MEVELNFAGQDKGYLTELSSIHQVTNITLSFFAKLMLRNETDSKKEMERLAKEMADRSEEAEYEEETEEEGTQTQSCMHF